MITTVSNDQHEILKNIIALYCNGGFDADATYGKGNFYKNGVPQPNLKFDLSPRNESITQAEASALPLQDSELQSLVFDPPFIVGKTGKSNTGLMFKKFSGFRYISDLWAWYSKCMSEFARVIKPAGILVVKCQDTVSHDRQHLSHVFLCNEAAKVGFECLDIFVLISRGVMIGHNHGRQVHARKHHSYFLVFKRLKKS